MVNGQCRIVLHPVGENLAVSAYRQQMTVLGGNLRARYTSAMHTPVAPATSRLCQGPEHGGDKEVATVVDGVEIGGVGQHIAQFRFARLVDGVRLRTKVACQRDIVQRVGHQLGMFGLPALLFSFHALLLSHLIGSHCLLGRILGKPHYLDGPLSLLLRAERHLLSNLRLADGFLAALLREGLLAVCQLLHLFAHTSVHRRLFLMFTQLHNLRLQLADTLTIAMMQVKPCHHRRQ